MLMELVRLIFSKIIRNGEGEIEGIMKKRILNSLWYERRKNRRILLKPNMILFYYIDIYAVLYILMFDLCDYGLITKFIW